jgi:hypothetical protein
MPAQRTDPAELLATPEATRLRGVLRQRAARLVKNDEPIAVEVHGRSLLRRGDVLRPLHEKKRW